MDYAPAFRDGHSSAHDRHSVWARRLDTHPDMHRRFVIGTARHMIRKACGIRLHASEDPAAFVAGQGIWAKLWPTLVDVGQL